MLLGKCIHKSLRQRVNNPRTELNYLGQSVMLPLDVQPRQLSKMTRQRQFTAMSTQNSNKINEQNSLSQLNHCKQFVYQLVPISLSFLNTIISIWHPNAYKFTSWPDKCCLLLSNCDVSNNALFLHIINVVQSLYS